MKIISVDNFQKAHKKLFGGNFGKPKQLPQLLETLANLYFKDFYFYEQEISIITTEIIKLLKNRDFDSFCYWENEQRPYKLKKFNKTYLGYIPYKIQLIRIYNQVKLVNDNNLKEFHWPEIENYVKHSVKLVG